jgi:hypothetical protein
VWFIYLQNKKQKENNFATLKQNKFGKHFKFKLFSLFEFFGNLTKVIVLAGKRELMKEKQEWELIPSRNMGSTKYALRARQYICNQ